MMRQIFGDLASVRRRHDAGRCAFCQEPAECVFQLRPARTRYDRATRERHEEPLSVGDVVTLCDRCEARGMDVAERAPRQKREQLTAPMFPEQWFEKRAKE